MDKKHALDQPVLDKIELFIPPRVTLQIATIATERGQTINDVILNAIGEFIENSKQ
ncbi:hypothetical protein V6C27_04360 [Peptococcaceae bacterium 1198_IL3148]